MSDVDSVEKASKWFVVTSALFFVVWQAAAVVGVPRETEVVLSVMGFVLHVAFGKAYTLVPSYFDSTLRWPGAPFLQYPLTVFGCLLLAYASLSPEAALYAATGGAMWLSGVVVFVAAILSTIAFGYLRGTTATSQAKEDRRRVDLAANAFMPLAFIYLLLASYEVFAVEVGFYSLFGGLPVGGYHLLATGFAALLVFTVGFRLLPRFLVSHPPLSGVGVVLVAGGVAPLLLSLGFTRPVLQRVGGVLMAVAVTVFAAVYLYLYLRRERQRVGADSIVVASVFGLMAVALGLHMAFVGGNAGFVAAHVYAAVTGFLGLTIVGVAFHFYPPEVCPLPYAGDRLAQVAIASVGAGVLVRMAGVSMEVPYVESAGGFLGLMGAGLYCYLVVGLLSTKR